MKHIFKIYLILLMALLHCSNILAQIKLPKAHLKLVQSAEDSLLKEFQNTVYYTFYNPEYMRTTTPTLTMLKINIDGSGNVSDIIFSDSADQTFIKAWLNKENQHDNKATLQKYAKIKGYYNVSLLIPVSYQPNYPKQQKVFSYDELSAIMKFNKLDFKGNAIVLSPIIITVLPHGNM